MPHLLLARFSILIALSIIIGSGCMEAVSDCSQLFGQIEAEIEDRRTSKLTYRIQRPELFDFQWSNGSTSQTITVLQPDEYCVTVTAKDNESCISSACYSLDSSSTEVLDEEDITRVLLIGNSITYSYDMPELLKGLMDDSAISDSVNVTDISKGGWTLQNHAESFETLDAINSEEWDYVVLQEGFHQTFVPVAEATSSSYFFAENLVNKVQRNNFRSQIVLLMRPGSESGVEDLCEDSRSFCTFNSMLNMSRLNSITMSELFECEIAPCGVMWKLLMDQGMVGLFDADGHHPAPRGAFVIASTIFVSATNQPLQVDLLDTDLFTMDEQEDIVHSINSSILENMPDWQTY